LDYLIYKIYSKRHGPFRSFQHSQEENMDVGKVIVFGS